MTHMTHMTHTTIDLDLAPAVVLIRRAIPDVIAIYLFGSHAKGYADHRSDIDLALLARKPLDPGQRFELQLELANLLRAEVDLVDLSSTSAVMRAQILSSDVLLFDGDSHSRAEFEMYALAGYARLNEERRHILRDIAERGTVHG